jgi:hypothetical protein
VGWKQWRQSIADKSLGKTGEIKRARCGRRMHRALDPDWQLEEECCQSMKERWEEEVRCLRGIRYNRRASINRPAFAMQQCIRRKAFIRIDRKYRISPAVPAFRRLFYSRKMRTHEIHIIVIRHFTARPDESADIIADDDSAGDPTCWSEADTGHKKTPSPVLTGRGSGVRGTFSSREKETIKRPQTPSCLRHPARKTLHRIA